MHHPLLLLVEDNPDDAALAKRALTKSKLAATMRVVGSGQDAWDILTGKESTTPQAVFLDLNMPGWSGFDLLERLRARESTRLLPVVVLTTSREPSDIERCYKLGANGYVTKPVDFGEFCEKFATMTSYWMGLNEVV